MKKLVLLASCLLVLSGQLAVAAVADPPIVMVRILEKVGSVHLIIERGTDKPEVMEFESGVTDDRAASVNRSYYDVLTKLYQSGYILQGTIAGAPTANITVSTLIFVKPSRP